MTYMSSQVMSPFVYCEAWKQKRPLNCLFQLISGSLLIYLGSKLFHCSKWTHHKTSPYPPPFSIDRVTHQFSCRFFIEPFFNARYSFTMNNWQTLQFLKYTRLSYIPTYKWLKGISFQTFICVCVHISLYKSIRTKEQKHIIHGRRQTFGNLWISSVSIVVQILSSSPMTYVYHRTGDVTICLLQSLICRNDLWTVFLSSLLVVA